MADNRINILKNEKISKAINKMSLPAIIGFLIMGIYNFVDTIFVAWIGTAATSATQVVFPIMMLASSIGLAFGIGSASYVSRLLGMNNKEKACNVATVALITSITVGIIFAVLSIFLIEPILKFFGSDESIMNMSKDYGIYILIGSMFTMGNMTMNNLLRSEGSATLSMIGMGIGSIFNIILDPIFIFSLGLGIKGAAIATTISQIISFIILLSRYIFKKTVINIGFSYYKPSKDILFQIGKVGIPTFFRQVLFSISLGILNQGAVNYGGATLLASIGLVIKILMIPTYVIFGIGQGFQPVLGYNFGAKNKERVVESLKYTLKLAFTVAIFSTLVIFVFDDIILSIFKVNEEVTRFSKLGLKLNVIALNLMAISNTISIFYQALGRGIESLILSISRQGLFFIPAVIILPLMIGYKGILGAQLCADIMAFVLSIALFAVYNTKDTLNKDMLLE
jgi:putative MATE family efflux protein